jgi:hypothetical protein
MTGILTCKDDLYRIWCSSFSVYPSHYLCAVHCNTNASQTAKDVGADQDALVEMFERTANNGQAECMTFWVGQRALARIHIRCVAQAHGASSAES